MAVLWETEAGMGWQLRVHVLQLGGEQSLTNAASSTCTHVLMGAKELQGPKIRRKWKRFAMVLGKTGNVGQTAV